jgi:hypothetical protein
MLDVKINLQFNTIIVILIDDVLEYTFFVVVMTFLSNLVFIIREED